MIGPKIIAKIFEFIANHRVAIATFCVTLVITIVSQAVLYHGLTNGNLTIDAICMSFIFIRCRDVDFDGKSYRQFEIKVPFVLYTVLKIILTPIYWIFVLFLIFVASKIISVIGTDVIKTLIATAITPFIKPDTGLFKKIHNYFGEVVDKPNKATRGDIIISTFYYVFVEYFIIVMFISIAILFVMCYSIYSSMLCVLKFMLTAGIDHSYTTFNIFTMASPIFVTVRHASTKVKGSIKSNNLSLRALKAELDELKAKNASVASHTITNDAKGNQVIKTRWSLNPMAALWIFSTILTYAHKLPVISKIIKLLAMWYGRTTWWTVLVKSRKMFVVLNALIGMYTLIGITGFSTDNIIAGITGLGYAYVEIISNLSTRVFNWLFNLFDRQIVPKVPDSKPSWKFWSGSSGGDTSVSPKLAGHNISNPLSNYLQNNQSESLRGIYKNVPTEININTNSSSDWSIGKYLFWGGLTLIGIGAVYLGFKYISESSFITNWMDVKGKGKDLSGDPGPSNPTVGVLPPLTA